MTFRSQLSEAVAPVVDLVYPPRCPLCGEAIEAQAGLCAPCWSELSIPSQPSCAGCQRPLESAMVSGEVRCGACLANPPKHDGIAAATLYNDASRRLVLAFKHGSRIAIAPMLAKLMAARLPDDLDNPLVVPVPLHRTRLWRRGFNQSALLARELVKPGRGELLVDALMRKKATPTLGGLGRKTRARMLSGAIAMNPKQAAAISGRDVVLVDDVLTSGATSEACVAVLKRANADRVVIACFARVLNEIDAA